MLYPSTFGSGKFAHLSIDSLKRCVKELLVFLHNTAATSTGKQGSVLQTMILDFRSVMRPKIVVLASVLVSPLGCWSTAPHAVVPTLMREHYYCVYLYMLCRLTY